MIDELFEYGVYLALLVALAIPLSAYLNKVMAGQKTVLSRVLVPVENAVYRCIRVDKSEDMGWKRYLVSAFAFSAICLVGLFAILMLQGLLPLNPEGIPGMSWDLAFNTAVSFVTNTNWQAYSGESALSYFSQAIGLTVQNFVTPAVGLGVLFALFRGIVSEGNPGLGNFWVDVTRAVLFVLIPLSLVVTMIDVQQGSPQNFNEYETVQLLEPVGVTADGSIVDADDPAAVETIDQATVPMGPQASQVAIKQLGTNGGGYNGVNSASALENPTPLTNLVQCLSLLLIPVACVFSFGRFVMDRRQGRAVFAAMFILLVGALVHERVVAAAEAASIADVIDALPQGYRTVVGADGTRLSGGEAQRLAIARAMLRDTPLIILDEATAYADAENEAKIQDAFAQLAARKTVLVIAHRMKTVRTADLIVVVDEGRVVGTGTHDDLMDACPLYRSMVDADERKDAWTLTVGKEG